MTAPSRRHRGRPTLDHWDKSMAGQAEASIYPDRPVVGLGVVVLKPTAAGPRVLLVKRGKPPRVGQWSIPGGRQQLGETLRAAAAREVLEETGVEAEIAHLLDVVDSISHDGGGRVRYHYSLIDFLGFWRAGEPLGASDVSEARWADPGDLAGFTLWAETERIIVRALELSRGD